MVYLTNCVPESGTLVSGTRFYFNYFIYLATFSFTFRLSSISGSTHRFSGVQVHKPMIVYLFAFLLCSAVSFAQPTLPDIAANCENKDVIISWQNQYDKIKVITVMRSADSLNDFEIIGYLKKPAKGINDYTDKKVSPGRYYYKLAIVFSTGLNWRSNFTTIVVPPPSREKPKELPQNEPTETQKSKPIVTKPPATQLESSFSEKNKAKSPDTVKKQTHALPVVAITFAADSNVTTKPVPPKPKIHYSYDEINDNTPIFIRSKYIYSDSESGHVRMDLPEDVETHHYSVKFYDKDKHMIIEVPKLNSTKIILDKRNFQHKGVYKFILRKDYTELESGFITIQPNK